LNRRRAVPFYAVSAKAGKSSDVEEKARSVQWMAFYKIAWSIDAYQPGSMGVKYTKNKAEERVMLAVAQDLKMKKPSL
jgi:hypothetical protein